MLDLFMIFWAWTFFIASRETAATRVTAGLSQPSFTPTLALHNASLYNASLSTGDTFMFAVPGTPISLMLSKFHGLLSQGELDLCIIEGLGSIFESVVAKGTDGGLPLHTWSSEWANNIINIDDFHPPDFVMTYGYLVTVLRGIALFTSQHGYVEMDFHVYLDNEGYIGAGNLGQIIPSKTS